MSYSRVVIGQRHRRRYLRRLIALFLPLSILTSTFLFLTFTGQVPFLNLYSKVIPKSEPLMEELRTANEYGPETSLGGGSRVSREEPFGDVSNAAPLELGPTHPLDCRTLSFLDSLESRINNNNICTAPILTMFTTMHEADKERLRIHNNTIINWSQLGSCVQQILFVGTKNGSLAQLAKSAGWSIELIPKSLQDIPILKSMFLTAFNLTYTPLYLYANSDILFDYSLVTTSRALLCALLTRKRSPTDTQRTPTRERTAVEEQRLGSSSILPHYFSDGIFAVGRRTNVRTKEINRSSVKPSEVTAMADGKKMFLENAQDYFLCSYGHAANPIKFDVITNDAVKINLPAVDSLNEFYGELSRNCSNGFECYTKKEYGSFRSQNGNDSRVFFPWDEVPDFVIGRPGYDNWLVAQAVLWNVSLAVDVSRTVRAVHQTGRFGVKSGRDSPGHYTTLYVNYEMSSQDYYFEGGNNYCLPWQSVLALDRRIVFIQRPTVPANCTKPKVLTSRMLRQKLMRRRLMTEWRWKNRMRMKKLPMFMLQRFNMSLSNSTSNFATRMSPQSVPVNATEISRISEEKVRKSEEILVVRLSQDARAKMINEYRIRHKWKIARTHSRSNSE